jgi:hypothetical protein
MTKLLIYILLPPLSFSELQIDWIISSRPWGGSFSWVHGELGWVWKGEGWTLYQNGDDGVVVLWHRGEYLCVCGASQRGVEWTHIALWLFLSLGEGFRPTGRRWGRLYEWGTVGGQGFRWIHFSWPRWIFREFLMRIAVGMCFQPQCQYWWRDSRRRCFCVMIAGASDWSPFANQWMEGNSATWV